MSTTVTNLLSDLNLLLRDHNTTVAPMATDQQKIDVLNLVYAWFYDCFEKNRSGQGISGFHTLDAATFTHDVDLSSLGLVREVLDCYVDDGAGATFTPLEPMGWSEIRSRQSASTIADSSKPTHYSAIKLGYAGGGMTERTPSYDQNWWKFAFFPVPGYANYPTNTIPYSAYCHVRVEPQMLTTTGSNRIELDDFQARCVVVGTAMLMAPRCNRADLVPGYKAMLPKMVRDHLENKMARLELVSR